MPDVEFANLFAVLLITLAAPLVLGLVPRLRIPAVVLEIVLGILVGPSVLGWVEIDLPVQIIALVGLAFLLFLAGLEIDVRRPRLPRHPGHRHRRGERLRHPGLGRQSAPARGDPVGDLAGSGRPRAQGRRPS
jgi:hypothetical protein